MNEITLRVAVSITGSVVNTAVGVRMVHAANPKITTRWKVRRRDHHEALHAPSTPPTPAMPSTIPTSAGERPLLRTVTMTASNRIRKTILLPAKTPIMTRR